MTETELRMAVRLTKALALRRARFAGSLSGLRVPCSQSLCPRSRSGMMAEAHLSLQSMAARGSVADSASDIFMTNTILGSKRAFDGGAFHFFWLGRKMLIDESEISYLAMEATVLVEAFEDTVKALGIDRNDELARLVVAKHIITFAKAGERDPARLHDLAVKAIHQRQRRPATASPGMILIHP